MSAKAPNNCICQVCGKGFHKSPSDIKLGRGKYCGQACQTDGRWTLTDFVCDHCGKTFEQPKNRRSQTGPVYCEDACSKAARRKPVDRICEHCGDSFTSTPARVAEGKARFCGNRCRGASMENKVRVICETCGTPFDRKASAVKDRTFCTTRCERNRHPQTIALSEDGLTGRIPLFARDGSIKDHTIIDAADIAWASQYRWYLSTKGYVVCGQGVYLHRELLGLAPGDGLFGDHKGMNPLDNRRSQLRPLTPEESPQNTPARPRSSEYRGVAWVGGTRPWVAYCSVGGVQVYRETFTDEHEAADAAREARRQFLPFATN
jgi:hypothetical protein